MAEEGEKLTTLEIEYEKISSQISWDIENCNIDYGYEDNNEELKRVMKIKYLSKIIVKNNYL